MTTKPAARVYTKAEHEFMEKVLVSPTYTPKRMLAKLHEKMFGERDNISVSQTSLILGVSAATYSAVAHRSAIIPAKMVINILDITGWSLEYFRSLCGLPSFVKSDEHFEELSSWQRRVVESAQSDNATANGQEDQHFAVRSGTDRRAMEVGRRVPGLEQSNWRHAHEPEVD
jgi:hypothetical protein